MRPIPKDVYDRVADLACGMTNATCAEDTALHDSLYEQLRAYYEDQARQGALHPFVVESLADYTSDQQEALRLYREALVISEPDEPRYTILISMAERLIKVGQREQAQASLREARAEAEDRNDADYVSETERVLRDLSVETAAPLNASPATQSGNSGASEGLPSVS